MLDKKNRNNILQYLKLLKNNSCFTFFSKLYFSHRHEDMIRARRSFPPFQYAQAPFDNLLHCTLVSQIGPAYQLQAYFLSNQYKKLQGTEGENSTLTQYTPKFPGFTRILSKHSATLSATEGAKCMSATRGML